MWYCGLNNFGREKTMDNIIIGPIGFLGFRQAANQVTCIFILSKSMAGKVALSSLQKGSVIPPYLYFEETGAQSTNHKVQKTPPRIDPELIRQMEKFLGLTFVAEKEALGNVCMANSGEVRPEFKQSFTPRDVQDYINGVLHSPKYRGKYKEFLKMDFPSVPFPAEVVEFWKLVTLGGELRQLYLLENPGM